MVTPMAAPAWNASLTAWMAAADQISWPSANPQLMDSTEGLRWLSCTAVVTASTQPGSVKCEKYTARRAPGATDPATSISSITSVSGLSCPGAGLLCMPSTDTAVTEGA